MSALADIDESGILLDGFIEESHAWEADQNLQSGRIPYREPWIGFLHNPHNMPPWYHPDNAPQAVFSRQFTRESLQHCRGILVLSAYLAEWVSTITGLPVSVIKHPAETPETTFSLSDYFDNGAQKVIQIGYWLRRLFSIQCLPTTRIKKIWLVTRPEALKFRDSIEIEHRSGCTYPVGDYAEIDWVDHDEYDRLLSRNLAFVDLYDASASTAVVDCIARSTPLLINPLPAVVEYLGVGYPFYFNSLGEAAKKAETRALIEDTHYYLAEMDKSFLDQRVFRSAFLDSEVFNRARVAGI